MLVPPFYSSHVLAAKVHHNRSSCTAADQIGTPHMRAGEAGLPLCEECAEIAAAERRVKAS